MKKNLILFLLFFFNSTLYSEDITESFQILKAEDIPNISINIGKYKSVNCELDNISKIYMY